MKKFAIALLSAGLLISSGLQAQENAGGADGSMWASGDMKKYSIIAGTVVAGLLVAGVANSNGSIVKPPIINPPPPPKELKCNGSDPLVDGVCIGATTTTTLTVSNSITTTISIPVTFTYLPTLG
jgi:hypothetical protein